MSITNRIDWTYTTSGIQFFPFDARPEEITIEDIASSLSKQCRYNGHVTVDFYSVAEHSIYVSAMVPQEQKLAALLHDAAEAYLGDFIRPLKVQPIFGEAYREIEQRLEKVIAQKFGLAYPWSKEIKAADEAVTTAEIAQIVRVPAHLPSDTYHDSSVEAPFAIIGVPPRQARELFLARYNDLVMADLKQLALS